MRVRVVLTAIVLGVMLLIPGVAAAVESSAATATAPLVTGESDVQVWMAAKPSEAVVIVSVQIPESTELPAKVRIPVIDGMVVDWVGEISGGDASQDPARPYTTQENPSGGSYVELVLTQYHSAQVDLSGAPMTMSGDDVSAKFEFVQSTVASETVFAVRLPALASEVKIRPEPVGDPQSNESGETLHVLPSIEMKPGNATTIEVAYTTALQAVPGTEEDAAINTLIAVLAVITVVIVAVLVVAVRRSQSARPETDDDED